MAKASSQRKDPNVTAFNTVQTFLNRSEEKPAKNPAAVALGRLGGLKGGKARAEKLSKSRRSAIAKKAAKTRWADKGHK